MVNLKIKIKEQIKQFRLCFCFHFRCCFCFRFIKFFAFLLIHVAYRGHRLSTVLDWPRSVIAFLLTPGSIELPKHFRLRIFYLV